MDREKTVTAKVWILKIIGNDWMCPFDRRRWSVIKRKSFFCLSGVKTADLTHILAREPFQKHKWFSSVLSIVEALWRSELRVLKATAWVNWWAVVHIKVVANDVLLNCWWLGWLLDPGFMLSLDVHCFMWTFVLIFFIICLCLQSVITHLIFRKAQFSGLSSSTSARSHLQRLYKTTKYFMQRTCRFISRYHLSIQQISDWMCQNLPQLFIFGPGECLKVSA